MSKEVRNVERPVISPLDGSEIERAVWTSPEDVAHAVSGARTAQRDWAAAEPTVRRRVLLDVAAAIRADADTIARLESLNTGKPVVDTLREAKRAADCFEYYAGWVDHVVGDTLPMGDANLVYTLREPVGVVAGIVPWNMPFAFAAKKIAPALAFGNACVLKPAPETPLTALRLKDMVEAAGAPEGLVRVLVGGGDVGAALVEADGLGLIVFTGSVATGKVVSRAAAGSLVPCVLELGGNSAQVVFDDCDIDAAVESVLLGGYASTGQMCVAGRRILVQESVYERFEAEVAERVENLVAGDVRRPGVSIGPQTTAAQRRITLDAIREAEAEGATIRAQGSIAPEAEGSGGFYVPPTLFTGLPEHSSLLREEVFGPVAAMTPFEDEAEALRLVNDSAYGLVAGVWTRDIVRAHRFARDVESGTVWINTFRVLNDRVPFGGVKDSGHGRENGASSFETYTRVKSVWASLEVGKGHGFGFAGGPAS
ncbi:aldehyde dehydrogenase family protein [Nocardiopsis sp. ATB16-24]|uniref:aldehyde dehydrogenase family protein n=1 Tax=Nocardiopsis sp. ATB16-24 TaxID=3019555 RepID=UPI0025572436|nr:aldehyde dehydrogenase family protein [Nocardiopsis sp. ATB16-24]